MNFLARPHQDKSHDHVYREVNVASAWNGSYLSKHPELWMDVLNEHDNESLHQAILHFQAMNKSMRMMTASDFPISQSLQAKIAQWDYQLRPSGRGFQVIRGLPVQRWTMEQAEICFFALGLYLGIPGAQDIQGSLLGHVKDIGKSNVTERPYRQADNIAYHCDGSDVVGLMCIHPSKEGGASRIISSVTMYNQLLRHRSGRGQRIVRRLFQKVLIYTRKTFGMATHMPVAPMRQDSEGVIRTYWNQDYYRKAFKHDNGTLTTMGAAAEAEHLRELERSGEMDKASGAGLQSDVIAGVEAYDELLVEDNARKRRNRALIVEEAAARYGDVADRSEAEERAAAELEEEGRLEVELGLDMNLQQGDIQLVANHFVLHARTAFTDHSDSELAAAGALDSALIPAIGKRDLLRLWLSHSDAGMPWHLYISKQMDYVRVIGGLLEGMIKYR